jgi:MOSC domain-containing protein YiiM
VGDSHAGLSEREVSLLTMESIERANKDNGVKAGPGDFAENLTTEGLDLGALKVGDWLRAGEAELVVVQLGKPLGVAHTYNYQGVSILPREGVFCRVARSGWVRCGDEIAVMSPSPDAANGNRDGHLP